MDGYVSYGLVLDELWFGVKRMFMSVMICCVVSGYVSCGFVLREWLHELWFGMT